MHTPIRLIVKDPKDGSWQRDSWHYPQCTYRALANGANWLGAHHGPDDPRHGLSLFQAARQAGDQPAKHLVQGFFCHFFTSSMVEYIVARCLHHASKLDRRLPSTRKFLVHGVWSEVFGPR